MPEVLNAYGYQITGWGVPIVLLMPLFLIVLASVVAGILAVREFGNEQNRHSRNGPANSNRGDRRRADQHL